MKDAFWLRHDSNAQHDERILELRAEFGWEGYGLFWALVERMRDAQEYRLAMATMGGLATSMGLLKPRLLALIDLCCTHGLFAMAEESAYVYSPSLRRRMEEWDTKKAALADAGKRGQAAKKARQAEATLAEELSQVEATLKPPLSHPDVFLSRVDKSREEEIKEEASLRSANAATAAASAPEKKIADEYSSHGKSIPESRPAAASHTGGAADVPTRKPASRFAYDPADIHPGLVLPFDTDEFRTLWAGYRQYREEQKLPRLTGGMQEQEALRKLNNLAGGSATTAQAIISQTIERGYKNLYKLDEPRPNIGQHAPERGAKPTANAALGARALAEHWAALDAAERQQPVRGDAGTLAAGTYAGQGPR